MSRIDAMQLYSFYFYASHLIICLCERIISFVLHRSGIYAATVNKLVPGAVLVSDNMEFIPALANDSVRRNGYDTNTWPKKKNHSTRMTFATSPLSQHS